VKRLVLIAFMLGCSSSSSSLPEATQTLGDLQYAPPPSGWNHRDTKEISRLVSRWTPEANVNKESISIITTSARANVKAAAPAQLEAMPAKVQRSLPAPSVLAPTMAKTKQGLQVDCTPPTRALRGVASTPESMLGTQSTLTPTTVFLPVIRYSSRA
jgi:hypothetical protein